MKTRALTVRLATIATALMTLTSAAHGAIPGLDDFTAARARKAIVEMDVAAARGILGEADEAEPTLALEKARLLLYEQDYDAAVALLERGELASSREGAELLGIARGSARATAAAVRVLDETAGVEIRFQHEGDQALAPLLVDTAVRGREMLARELGVELPRPLRMVIVGDQRSLAAMTGLPEDAARTTGTVAVAKWGRLTMLSPRAMPRGYPWLDTLVHEITHLAITRGTTDKAPLWLQEGVAKRQETRWRTEERWDGQPSADYVAKDGVARGLGVRLDGIGPSIAMLPSAEQASIAFAQVSSFIRFWVRESGDEALPELLRRIQLTSGAGTDLDNTLQQISGADFASWDGRFRAYLEALPEAPEGALPSKLTGNVHDISRFHRLGELLMARGHHGPAAIELTRAQALATGEPMLRCSLAAALLASGEREKAAALVSDERDVDTRLGRWFSLHARLANEPAAEPAWLRGLALDPLSPFVACEERPLPELPESPLRRALCEAARKRPGLGKP